LDKTAVLLLLGHLVHFDVIDGHLAAVFIDPEIDVVILVGGTADQPGFFIDLYSGAAGLGNQSGQA
jgi:hypothetical protein